MVIEKKYGKKGYIFDTQTLRLELYRLLCYFIASERLAKEEPIFEEFLDEFQKDQIKTILITTAITVRVIYDRDRKHLKEFTKCGKLHIGSGRKKEVKNLDLREACNKIIHAEDIKFELFDKDYPKKIKPFVNLYGVQEKVRWKAIINIIEFVKKIEYQIL